MAGVSKRVLYSTAAYISGRRTTIVQGDSSEAIEAFAFPITDIVYDDDDRVISYTKNEIEYTCTYYTSGNGNGQLESIEGNGQTLTLTYNSDSLLESQTVT